MFLMRQARRLARRRVHAGGAEVRLTQREWALFDTLLGARGRVLPMAAVPLEITARVRGADVD